MGFYTGGLIIGRIFASEWGAYFREGLFLFIIYLFLYQFFLGGGGGGSLSESYGTSRGCPFLLDCK